MNRSYYSMPIGGFLKDDKQAILGELAVHHEFDLNDLQRNSWIALIQILKNGLAKVSDGHILIEYCIPRMGKRIDVVLLIEGILFPIEFKHHATSYTRDALDQVLDYSLDLKNFHEESHCLKIIPILLAQDAPIDDSPFKAYEDRVFHPLKANAKSLDTVLSTSVALYKDKPLLASQWENSRYLPTPTIIEAAQALYKNHNVKEISRSDSGAINLQETSDALNMIINDSKKNHKKTICFVTGVPGAGKTLAGLNIANQRHHFAEDDHAVFLSGNGPLVKVLQEALARDKVETAAIQGKSIKKKSALAATKSFVQNIHHFRDDAISSTVAPVERVAIFDEAQRAWTKEHTTRFMLQKKGKVDFGMSEPDFLISAMDRHQDWAVIVCLVGEGQEINTGEAGLPEWFHALREKYPHWHVFLSSKAEISENANDILRSHGLPVGQVTHDKALQFL